MPSHHAKQMQAKKKFPNCGKPASDSLSGASRKRSTPNCTHTWAPFTLHVHPPPPQAEYRSCMMLVRRKEKKQHTTIHPIQPTTKQLCARLLLFTHRSLAGRVISHLSGMGSVAGGWFVIRFLPPCMPLSVLVIFIAGVLVLVRENFSFSPHGWFTLGLH